MRLRGFRATDEADWRSGPYSQAARTRAPCWPSLTRMRSRWQKSCFASLRGAVNDECGSDDSGQSGRHRRRSGCVAGDRRGKSARARDSCWCSVASRLHALSAKHALIGDVRGRGLAIGLELVKDRSSREPVPVATTAKVVYRAYQLRVKHKPAATVTIAVT